MSGSAYFCDPIYEELSPMTQTASASRGCLMEGWHIRSVELLVLANYEVSTNTGSGPRAPTRSAGP